MMEGWLATSPWQGVILWVILYTSDYYLTLYAARQHKSISQIQFEGSIELTPQFQNDIDHLKPISRRHVILLVVFSIIISVIWWLLNFLGTSWGYLVILGMLLLMEIAVHIRHLRNIFLFREINLRGGVEGSILYRRWFSYQISFFDFALFGGLFLLTAILTGSWFFAGGVISCFLIAFKHKSLSGKTFQKANSTSEEKSRSN
jgi:hypothetical protein